ncbi:MAG: hypothetical protein ACUVQ5_00105 [Candidatus Methanomethylicaceae archaeon]
MIKNGNERKSKAKDRLAYTAPITLILVTTAMFLLTNFLATSSLISIANFKNDDVEYRKYVIGLLHSIIEHMYSSNPGSSLTIILNPHSEIVFTRNSILSEGIDGIELQDRHSILNAVTSKEIIYDGAKISFVPTSIPIGLSKVTLTIVVVGAVKLLSIEVERP